MNREIVQAVTYSILSRAQNEQILIGTTKLTKLLYLIDCEFYRWNKRTLTDANWRFYLYGPYSEALLQVAHATNGIEPGEQIELEDGRFHRNYRVVNWHADPMNSQPAPIRAIVDRVYKKWASIDLPLLLDYVYFDTAPMAMAIRNTPLDFSTITTALESAETEPIRDYSKSISKKKIADLKERLRTRAQKYEVPKPIVIGMDDESLAAFARMDDES